MLSDPQHHMGIDRHAAGIHYLELYCGEAFAQHDFQVAAESVGGVWISHCGGLTQHGDAIRPGRLLRGNGIETRGLHRSGRKERCSEEQVVAGGGLALDSTRRQQRRRVANSRDAQARLHDCKHQQRDEDRADGDPKRA